MMIMESKKVQVIKEAIKQVMEEDGDCDEKRLLSRLMTELEEEEGSSSSSEERILEEVKKLKRQNVITHCLVSVMILLTVAWQISEVSIILKLKDGVAHPFRSIGAILKSLIIKPKPTHQPHHHSAIDDSAIDDNLLIDSSSPLHDLKLPNLHLPAL